uniref:NAC transcription factor 35 n=1 Tax=Litchi chinensis TaxID=151069 RepID=A0A8K1MDX0_LITCN|nr:NAC transcription factor 35 [Litchi chinensis]
MCDASVNLPPGFRFLPTDEELVLHFLHRKVSLLPCHPNIIPDIDPYLLDPWQLNGKAFSSGNQWYFFSQMMENRVTGNGYWKQLDVEEPIFNGGGKKVGLKKSLVFFIGEDPAGIETNWVMQEYQLCSSATAESDYKRKANRKLDCYKWVLCRVYEREGNSQSFYYGNDDDDNGTELSCLDEMFLSLDDDLADISLPNN